MALALGDNHPAVRGAEAGTPLLPTPPGSSSGGNAGLSTRSKFSTSRMSVVRVLIPSIYHVGMMFKP